MSLRARLAERGNLPPIVAVLVKCGTGRKREIEGRRAGRRGRHCRGGSIGVHLSLLRYRPACRCLYRVENALRKPAVVVDTGGRPGTRRKGVNHGTAQEIAALVAWVLGVWLVLADGCRLPPLGQQGRNPATTGVLPLTRVRKKTTLRSKARASAGWHRPGRPWRWSRGFACNHRQGRSPWRCHPVFPYRRVLDSRAGGRKTCSRIEPARRTGQIADFGEERKLSIQSAIRPVVPRALDFLQLAVSSVMVAFQSSAKRPTAVCSRLLTVPTGIPRIPAISA